MIVMDTITPHTHTPNRDGNLTTAHVAELTGATYRQLDYWCRQGAITPAQAANGSGTRRSFAPAEVRIVRAVAALMDLGCTVDEAGQAAAELRYLPVEHWTGPWIARGRILSLDTLRG